jgi:hypothetical protein
MKYYLDEDLSPTISQMLRKRGVDAISAHEIGMVQASDRKQLEHAVSQSRCIVTRNRDDFIRLTVQFFNEHRPHFGLLILPYSIPGDRFQVITRVIARHASNHPKGMASYEIGFLKP